MALTAPYTIELVNKILPYNIDWIEEFLPPDDVSFWDQFIDFIFFFSR